MDHRSPPTGFLPQEEDVFRNHDCEDAVCFIPTLIYDFKM